MKKNLLASKNSEKKYFKNVEDFKITLLMQEVLFFSKTKFSMEIC
jgi:hypothetical protein